MERMKAWEIWKLDYFAVILMWFFWSATYCYTFSISFFFLGILTWVLRVPFTLSNYLFIAWKSNILIGERMKSFRRWKRLGLWLNYLFIKKNKIIITICWTGALIGTKEPQFVWFRHWFVKIESSKIEIFNRIQNWNNAFDWWKCRKRTRQTVELYQIFGTEFVDVRHPMQIRFAYKYKYPVDLKRKISSVLNANKFRICSIVCEFNRKRKQMS